MQNVAKDYEKTKEEIEILTHAASAGRARFGARLSGESLAKPHERTFNPFMNQPGGQQNDGQAGRQQDSERSQRCCLRTHPDYSQQQQDKQWPMNEIDGVGDFTQPL
jgi:hypothetical protein